MVCVTARPDPLVMVAAVIVARRRKDIPNVFGPPHIKPPSCFFLKHLPLAPFWKAPGVFPLFCPFPLFLGFLLKRQQIYQVIFWTFFFQTDLVLFFFLFRHIQEHLLHRRPLVSVRRAALRPEVRLLDLRRLVSGPADDRG